MIKNKKTLPLRLGVGIALLNHEYKIFVGKRIDNPTNSWQMPQGGVNQNENFLEAANRELEEENGIKKVELIKELDGTITYELPDRLLGIIWKGKYKGQKQKWYFLQLTGDTSKVCFDTSGSPEFDGWQWVNYWYPINSVVSFKRNVYRNALHEFAAANMRFEQQAARA